MLDIFRPLLGLQHYPALDLGLALQALCLRPLLRAVKRTVEMRVVIAFVLVAFFCLCPVHGQTPSPAATTDFDAFANTLLATSSDQERQNLLSQKKDLLTPDLRKALIRQGNTH